MKKRIMMATVLFTVFFTLSVSSRALGADYYGGFDETDDDFGWEREENAEPPLTVPPFSPITTLDIILYGFFAVSVAGIIVVAFIFPEKKRKQETASKKRPARYERKATVLLPKRNDEIEKIITKHDARFSAEEFIGYARRVFNMIQSSHCSGDLSALRGTVSELFYERAFRQISAENEEHIRYHCESIRFTDAYLNSYKIIGQNEQLSVFLSVRMIDYKTAEPYRRIIKGDKTTEWKLRYLMKFVRQRTVISQSGETSHELPFSA